MKKREDNENTPHVRGSNHTRKTRSNRLSETSSQAGELSAMTAFLWFIIRLVPAAEPRSLTFWNVLNCWYRLTGLCLKGPVGDVEPSVDNFKRLTKLLFGDAQRWVAHEAAPANKRE
jgi:hypothetical protein